MCQLAPHGCEDSAAIEISAFRRISGGADVSYFFEKKLPHKSPKIHQKMPRTLFSPLKGQLKPAKFLTTKKLFEFVVESHGREIVISNLNHKEKTKRNTRRGLSCLRVAGSYVRDWRKRRRYATRADRLVLRQSVRRIESMAPSASLILLTLRFDRQVTASSANADRATKHFRYQKPFF